MERLLEFEVMLCSNFKAVCLMPDRSRVKIVVLAAEASWEARMSMGPAEVEEGADVFCFFFAGFVAGSACAVSG